MIVVNAIPKNSNILEVPFIFEAIHQSQQHNITIIYLWDLHRALPLIKEH